MRYAVYVNWTRKRACWHRDGCGYIQMKGGTAERANQAWVWCESVAEVRSVLADRARGFKASEVRACAHCRPDAAK